MYLARLPTSVKESKGIADIDLRVVVPSLKRERNELDKW